MKEDQPSLQLPGLSLNEDVFAALDQFTDSGIITNYSKYYSWIGIDKDTLYQGDGIRNLVTVNLPDTTMKEVPSLLLSNTCDVDPKNRRKFPSRLVYAPIMNLDEYEKVLKEERKHSNSHIQDIKKQRVTQILFLPKGQGLENDSLVFLDQLNSCPSGMIDRKSLGVLRIFSLSQQAFYLLTIKLSVHFTRLREGVERG